MLHNLPLFIPVVFALTTLATLIFLLATVRKSGVSTSTFSYVTIGLLVWLAIKAALAFTGFYKDTTSVPPRLIFAVGPPLLAIVLLFSTGKGRRFLDRLPLSTLTYTNAVRIPVELVLYWLFLHKTIPELMTFTGRNFDILVGMTAPVVAYLGLTNQYISKRVVLVWNVLSLGLLLNIVFHGILSAPTPFQQFAFKQPNIALLHAPFIWLPTFIVPVALLTHLVSIRQLTRAAASSTANSKTAIKAGLIN
ncbi:hypothetical protein [Telluribacter sp. SYSU D00476]|uniref:hypothetical protein n=1 Tax=Telluribacter sp. SYSU D00476 TaxID=2811430 RepID=UPI001FF68316|nr:hypothetical protein [Telluribacter sp. SYSU D00476]